MIALALLFPALAANVYLNGVRADVLPEVTLTNTTVRIDAEGNVWIDAPGYRVQVVSPTEYARPAAVPTPPPEASGASRVGQGTWWLVTEDNGSTGQALDLLVNGALVRRINSGDPQMILDVGPWLQPGANTILVNPAPGAQPGGGALNVYIGRGSNLSGTIRLDNPDVVYTRRGSDSGGARQFTLTVP